MRADMLSAHSVGVSTPTIKKASARGRPRARHRFRRSGERERENVTVCVTFLIYAPHERTFSPPAVGLKARPWVRFSETPISVLQTGAVVVGAERARARALWIVAVAWIPPVSECEEHRLFL